MTTTKLSALAAVTSQGHSSHIIDVLTDFLNNAQADARNSVSHGVHNFEVRKQEHKPLRGHLPPIKGGNPAFEPTPLALLHGGKSAGRFLFGSEKDNICVLQCFFFWGVFETARHELRETVHCLFRVTKTLKMFTQRFFGGHIDHVHRFHHGRLLLVPLGKTWKSMRSLLLISFRKLFGMRKVLIPSMRKCLVLPST